MVPKALLVFVLFLESLMAAVPGNRPCAQPVDFRQVDQDGARSSTSSVPVLAHSHPPEDAGNGRV